MWSRRCAMRSRRLEALAACLALAAAVGAANAVPATPPTRDSVDEAASTLKQIQTLTGTRTERSLRLKDDKSLQPPAAPTPQWLRWIGEFAAWLGGAGRVLVWLLAALAVAFAVVRAHAWLRLKAADRGGRLAALPTHVRDLDIRPETLPEDVGAAAWALWRAGRATEALSLLYRGSLSQLVHRHAVPILASSTEGDCLRLAQPRLPEAAQRYLELLVATWRQAVYAGRLPADAQAEGLCRGFGSGLGSAP